VHFLFQEQNDHCPPNVKRELRVSQKSGFRFELTRHTNFTSKNEISPNLDHILFPDFPNSLQKVASLKTAVLISGPEFSIFAFPFRFAHCFLFEWTILGLFKSSRFVRRPDGAVEML